VIEVDLSFIRCLRNQCHQNGNKINMFSCYSGEEQARVISKCSHKDDSEVSP
jgi:hypothetical protein